MRMYKIYMFTSLESRHAPSLRFQAHLAFPQGLPSIQKCQKSLQARPTPTNGQKDSAAKIKVEISEDKNGQLVTGGIFYCRDSAEINVCGSLQTSSWLDSEVHRSRQQKHTAIRCASYKKSHRTLGTFGFTDTQAKL